jgi:putative PIN family toxin of toxin-antitoxin system
LIRVTVDTNVLVSATVFPRGKPFQLLDLAREGKVELAVSDAILNEVADVLARKFHLPPEDVAEARRRLQANAINVAPIVKLEVIKEDPADNRILECALSAGSEYIVSGDKDLLRLKRYETISIVTVADFLALMIDPNA